MGTYTTRRFDEPRKPWFVVREDGIAIGKGYATQAQAEKAVRQRLRQEVADAKEAAAWAAIRHLHIRP
jgi:phosphoribosylamine-glycine ligase